MVVELEVCGRSVVVVVEACAPVVLVELTDVVGRTVDSGGVDVLLEQAAAMDTHATNAVSRRVVDDRLSLDATLPGIVEPAVDAALCDELLMSTILDDSTVVEHQHPIS